MFKIIRLFHKIKNFKSNDYHNNITIDNNFNLFCIKHLYIYYLKDMKFTFVNITRNNEFLIQDRRESPEECDFFFSSLQNIILTDTTEYSDTELLLIFGKKFTDEEFINRYGLTNIDYEEIIRVLESCIKH